MPQPRPGGSDCVRRQGDRFFAVEVGAVEWPDGLTVNDLMADIAAIFHWPLSELNDLPLAELLDWRHKALIRSGANTDE
ncbi:GpE family phage tail protein [Kalamiella piersonii]|nr:GpE family phage tail protein [Pantoea piersonii]NYB06616.1 GpE family phage tail protein [Pantoea piersonii]NYB34238.1 GpE family phage tail protein [Pantoea piersonii]